VKPARSEFEEPFCSVGIRLPDGDRVVSERGNPLACDRVLNPPDEYAEFMRVHNTS
jgi:hypothetical protein